MDPAPRTFFDVVVTGITDLNFLCRRPGDEDGGDGAVDGFQQGGRVRFADADLVDDEFHGAVYQLVDLLGNGADGIDGLLGNR